MTMGAETRSARRSRWIGPAGALAGAVLVAALTALAASPADAVCARVPIIDPVTNTSLDDIVVCTDPGEDADGTIAISLQGDARASGPLPLLALSGTGSADRSLVCLSGTGQAGGPDDQNLRFQCAASASVAGDDANWPDDSDRQSASALGLAYSTTGTARATVAVSVLGDSEAPVVSVSGFGEARGHTYTGQHPAPFIAVSGCKAEHSEHDDYDNGQILTADPTRVHVLADLGALSDPNKEWGPTDIGTGETGRSVQSVTCSLGTNQD
jgi:hypothetical protein